ncbi:hypothetical protein MMC29_000153 [Sticta canariensis]|nr:hypothetical protein [Sticta canariensis]
MESGSFCVIEQSLGRVEGGLGGAIRSSWICLAKAELWGGEQSENKPTSTSEVEAPYQMQSFPSAMNSLSVLTQLSPSVYLSEPPRQRENAAAAAKEEASLAGAGQAGTDISPPKLIILVTWMSAHPIHISKYILGYRARYPASRAPPLDLFYRRPSTQRRRIAPAVFVVLSSCSAICHEPEIILHVFSNGGSHQTLNLLRAYGETNSSPFPSHVRIFDSCAGRATFKRSVLALSSALPAFPSAHLVLLLLIYIVISIYWVVFVPFGIPDPAERVRRALRSRVFIPEETKRCYIYSETDPMIGRRDVEAHAQLASGEGFVVQHVKFFGGGHCAHVKVEGVLCETYPRWCFEVGEGGEVRPTGLL